MSFDFHYFLMISKMDSQMGILVKAKTGPVGEMSEKKIVRMEIRKPKQNNVIKAVQDTIGIFKLPKYINKKGELSFHS